MYEEKLIRRIKGGIAAIKRGEKTPAELGLGSVFSLLKSINEPMCEDLQNQYKQVISVKK